MHETLHRYGLDVKEGREGYVEYWTTRKMLMMYLIKKKKSLKNYKELWENEKKNTRRKMRIIKETRMDPNAEIDEYFTRKGRMMGIKETATKEEIQNIEDLRMTHTEV